MVFGLLTIENLSLFFYNILFAIRGKKIYQLFVWIQDLFNHHHHYYYSSILMINDMNKKKLIQSKSFIFFIFHNSTYSIYITAFIYIYFLCNKLHCLHGFPSSPILIYTLIPISLHLILFIHSLSHNNNNSNHHHFFIMSHPFTHPYSIYIYCAWMWGRRKRLSYIKNIQTHEKQIKIPLSPRIIASYCARCPKNIYFINIKRIWEIWRHNKIK